MRPYRDFAPTGFDSKGAFLPNRQDWLVLPTSQTRDSGPLDQSNFATALDMLGGESETVEVHRFGHWGPGWFEIIIVAPDSPAATVARDIEDRLANYPILDESDFSEREQESADETWKQCFNDRERVEYIRANRSQFSFHNFEDMLSCARGNYFAGYASELIEG